MAVQHSEMTTENLLNAVVRMPDKEFDKFVEKAKKLRGHSTVINWTKSETEIIRKINECNFSPEKQRRFANLVRKRQNEMISESEFEEISNLTDEGEERTLKRLKLLIRLAKSKNKSLDEIIKILDTRPPKTL